MRSRAEIRVLSESRRPSRPAQPRRNPVRNSSNRSSSIALDLWTVSGYQNLEVFTGQVKSDPKPPLKEALKGEYEIFTIRDGNFVALFVPRPRPKRPRRSWSRTASPRSRSPKGLGSRVRWLAVEDRGRDHRRSSKRSTKKLNELREKHTSLHPGLGGVPEHRRREGRAAPQDGSDRALLRPGGLGTHRRLRQGQQGLRRKFGDNIYVERLEDKSRVEHHETRTRSRWRRA